MTLPPTKGWRSESSCVSGMKRRGVGEHQWCLRYHEPLVHPGEVRSGFIRGEHRRLSGASRWKKSGAEHGVWGEQSKHRKWNRLAGSSDRSGFNCWHTVPSAVTLSLVLRCPQLQPFIPCTFRYGQSLETCLLS